MISTWHIYVINLHQHNVSSGSVLPRFKDWKAKPCCLKKQIATSFKIINVQYFTGIPVISTSFNATTQVSKWLLKINKKPVGNDVKKTLKNVDINVLFSYFGGLNCCDFK